MIARIMLCLLWMAALAYAAFVGVVALVIRQKQKDEQRRARRKPRVIHSASKADSSPYNKGSIGGCGV